MLLTKKKNEYKIFKSNNTGIKMTDILYIKREKMKKVVPVVLIMLVTLIANPAIFSTANAQDIQPAPKLFIAGGALHESGYAEFRKLTGSDATLIVIPTASSSDVIDVERIKEQWKSRGFPSITVLHTRDREIASSQDRKSVV